MPTYHSYPNHEKGMRFTEDVTPHVKPVYEEVKRRVVKCQCGRMFVHMAAYESHTRKYHGGVGVPVTAEQTFRKVP